MGSRSKWCCAISGSRRCRSGGVTSVSARRHPHGEHGQVGLPVRPGEVDLQNQDQNRDGDSGGLQEESTALGIPCLTLRENTERPATVTDGTNRIVGMRTQAILSSFDDAMAGRVPPRRPPLWDGQTGPRTATVLMEFLSR